MKVYIVAFEGSNFFLPTTRKTFKTEENVLKEYDRLREAGHENIKILEALWVESYFDEYEKLKENEK